MFYLFSFPLVFLKGKDFVLLSTHSETAMPKWAELTHLRGASFSFARQGVRVS